MPGDDALRFAERLLALLEATRYSATYKLATLLALMDVVAERTGADGSVPERISGKEVGRRVIELYWPQTVPYGAATDGQPRVLRQAPQNDIPAKLAAWRQAHRLGADVSLEDARAADPRRWRLDKRGAVRGTDPSQERILVGSAAHARVMIGMYFIA